MFTSYIRTLCVLSLTAATCFALPSLAADMGRPIVAKAPVVEPVPGWTFIATPYAWMPSIKGSTTIKGRTADVDMSFIDLLHRKIPKELFGLMGAFEARKGPVSIMTDLVYLKLGASGSGARATSVRPEIGGSLAGSFSVQTEMVIAEAALAYEIARWGQTGAGTGTALDIYGGGRFWWQTGEASLGLTAGLNIGDLDISGGRAVAKSGDQTWLDPIVGARLRHQFSPGTEFVLRGDVGGFGVGSKFTWQAMGTLNWDFARTQSAIWSAQLGYRALYVDYEKGAGSSLYQYDMLTHGPIVGLNARF